MLPLTWLQPGSTGYVKCIRGNDCTCRHLRSLGLTEGEPVRLTHRNGNNVVVAIRGCRLALDENLALRIFVSEQSPDGETQACDQCCTCQESHFHRKRRRNRRSVDTK